MRKLTFLITTLISLSTTTTFAQHWVSRFNGTGNGIDVVKSMVVDDAGNVYVTGYSFSPSNDNDYLTIKYNTSGTKLWTARYDGPGHGSDIPASIFVDASGNVYVTGSSDALTGTLVDMDAATIKYNSDGVQQWVTRYDGGVSRSDGGNAVKVDASGNVIITGSTSVFNSGFARADYLTIKYNSAGVQQWKATFNGPANEDDVAIGLALDNTGNTYVTGSIFVGADPLGEQDYFTIKYDPAGVQQWTAEYNGPASEPDFATAITVDKSANVYVTGYSEGTDLDYATIKYNSNGVQQWVERYNGPANSSDIAYAIAVDDAANVYVTGGDQKTINNEDYLTIKYNSSGVTQWTSRYDGTAHDNDEAYSIAVDKSGNVFVTGNVNGFVYNSDIGTIKYSPAGKQKWVKIYNGPKDSVDVGDVVAVDTFGNTYVAGTSTSKKSSVDYTVIKYPASGNTDPKEGSSELQSQQITLLNNYPNPFGQSTQIQFNVQSSSSNATKVKLSVFNLEGREVAVLLDESLASGNYQVQWDAEQFPAGIYYAKISFDGYQDTKKMVVIR